MGLKSLTIYTMISNDFYPKNPHNFTSNLRYFSSCNKNDYTRHIHTIKHIFNISQGFSTGLTQKTPYKSNFD